MKKGKMGEKQGFTLVETALVLGVAGLIFLMMFVALPALNRQERDTERREDVTKVVEELKKYQDNNRGALPVMASNTGGNGWYSVRASSIEGEELNDGGNNGEWYGFYRNYLGEEFFDPDGERYWLVMGRCDTEWDQTCTFPATLSGAGISEVKDPTSSNTTFPNGYSIIIVTEAKCSGDSSTGAIKSSNPRNFAVLYNLEGGGLYCAGA